MGISFDQRSHQPANLAGYGIITMAGASRRFCQYGYEVPKYRLPAFEKTLFHWSVRTCFPFYSRGYKMFFIVNKQFGDEKPFIKEHIRRLQITNYEIIEVDDFTDGQATTAMVVKDKIENKDLPIFIYNIDTMIDPGNMDHTYQLQNNPTIDGIIPVTRLPGKNWSFVQVDDDYKVLNIAEKKRISEDDLASVGFYWFRTWNMFEECYTKTYGSVLKNIFSRPAEKYVAPIYAHALKNNANLIASYIWPQDVHNFGSPEQYLEFLKKTKLANVK